MVNHSVGTEARMVDIAIVGGGPAGLTAGLYAARALRRTVLFEGGVLGGQIATAELVENYPGFADGVNGLDLVLAMQAQAERFGMTTVYATVHALRRRDDGFELETTDGLYRASAVILTAGASPTRLGVPGEDEFVGHGVSYCATCDAAFYREQHVAVIGGGDAAIDEALFTTRYASRVTVIHRRDSLRAVASLQERARSNPKIDFRWNTVVDAIQGNANVERLLLRDVATGTASQLAVDGVFIFIGERPNSGLLRDVVELDDHGFVPVTGWMETEVSGLFVAGDLRADSARQVVTAAGDGATAAIRADRYLSARAK